MGEEGYDRIEGWVIDKLFMKAGRDSLYHIYMSTFEILYHLKVQVCEAQPWSLDFPSRNLPLPLIAPILEIS